MKIASRRKQNINKLAIALIANGFYVTANELDPLSTYTQSHRNLDWQNQVLRVTYNGNTLCVPLSYYYASDADADTQSTDLVLQFTLSYVRPIHKK